MAPEVRPLNVVLPLVERVGCDGRLRFRQSHSVVAGFCPSSTLLLLHFGFHESKFGVQGIVLSFQIIERFDKTLDFYYSSFVGVVFSSSAFGGKMFDFFRIDSFVLLP